MKIDPNLDLIFERTCSLSPETFWKAWTDPSTLMKWFCPKPWQVTECRIELHPGGEFYTLMQGPDSQKIPNHGCFLELITNQKLVWTNMMTQGFRPTALSSMGFAFVCTILLSRKGSQTLYQAFVTHIDEAGRKQHEQMGFQEGWGMAFEQLLTLMEGH